ncbi:MAG: Lrp/AsnC family transcriptional regulator [Pseudomonadota bacterium]
MDKINRKIAGIIQSDGKASSTAIAERVGISVSSANERVRKLQTSGALDHWRGVLDPASFGIDLLVFVLVDMTYEGEMEALSALGTRPEIQEIHHISGPHSYLMKVRVRNAVALQDFLQSCVKPLPAVVKTETLLVLDTSKETTEIDLTQSVSETGP